MISLRFLSGWDPWVWLSLAVGISVVAGWLYRRELKDLGVGVYEWLLPLLRATAIFLIVLTLAEPVIESRHQEGQPGMIHFLIDGSQSMSLANDTGVSSSDVGHTRYQRVLEHLLNSQGLLSQLADGFELAAWRTNGGQNELIWQSKKQLELPSSEDGKEWQPNQFSSTTALGDNLVVVGQSMGGSNDRSELAAEQIVVLLSDGNSNAGTSAIAAAEKLATSGARLYTVGYGPQQPPSDVAIRTVSVPERVFKEDQLAGRVTVAESTELGQSYQVQVVHRDQVLWQQTLTSQQDRQREIQFSFPINAAYQNELGNLSAGAIHNALLMSLEVRLIPQFDELLSENNSRTVDVTVVATKAKILLVDGRSRWETRYLRNLFARDPAWSIDAVIADSPDRATLPNSRDRWQQYHLVILGDVPRSFWSEDQLTGLNEFVRRGGGLILIDGDRQHLHDSAYTELSELLPVEFVTAQKLAEQPQWTCQLTESGKRLLALQLLPSSSSTVGEISGGMLATENDAFWKLLPALSRVQPVKSSLGAETLVQADFHDDQSPLLVTRRFGAGRTLYVATDETWRWRFKVADQVHQKLWNQLGRWTMRQPLSVESEYASLDSGAASYQTGQPIQIKAALRAADGSPAVDKRVVATISRDGIVAARVTLAADDSGPGFYLASLRDLPAGSYSVGLEAEGYTQEALNIETRFVVRAGEQHSDMTSLGCDVATLTQLANATGGRFVHETQIDDLAELLRPLSGGRIVRSTQLIWQSYYWFCAALALLAIEWALRKRVGLI